MPVVVRHKNCCPVLVLGHGRSGTTILQGLLRRYLRVSFGTESQFIPRYYYGLSAYGDLNDDANLRKLLADLVKERWFQRSQSLGFWTSADSLFEKVRTRTFRGVLDAIFGELARQTGMQRWGDKTPDYVFHLPVLKSLFPDAKYVSIVRDGRDVALSVFELFWGPKNIPSAALEWNHTVQLVKDFEPTISADQFLQIRYEDLLDQPVDVFSRLINFLEIDDSNGEILANVDRNIRSELKAGNYNKWKHALTPRQIRQFDAIAGDLLRQYGYETMDVPRRTVGSLEAAYWNVDSRLRRFARRDYWRDNAYRWGLMGRDLARRLGLRNPPAPDGNEPPLVDWAIHGEHGAGI